MKFQPMLASRELPPLSNIHFPVLVSPKLDGIRCVIYNGQALSRTLKPIPNRFVTAELEGLPDGLDGELIIPGKTFNEIQSAIMRRDGEPNFMFCVFDCAPNADVLMDEFTAFWKRLVCVRKLVKRFTDYRLEAVEYVSVSNIPELFTMEERYVTAGYEGLMIRDPIGPYKYGRSTADQGWLLKMKRFEDAEATVIGAVERLHNSNTLTTDNLGHAKRSYAKAGMVPTGDLGALVCRSEDGVEFEIGAGFKAKERVEFWKQHELGKLKGLTVTYKHQPHGAKEKPRLPIFKGFRYD